MRNEIWLGDLARAYAVLRPSTASERAAIASLLGFQPQPEAEVQTAVTGPSGPLAKGSLSRRRRRRPVVSLARPTPAEDREQTAERTLIRPVRTDPGAAVVWTADALPMATDEQLRAPPPHMPLFAPRSTTAMLQTLLSCLVPEGAVDTDSVVEQLARQRPVTWLPRRARRSLRFGVQVLIDRGEAMQPFRRDQQELAAQIIRVAGRDRTQLQYFIDSPFHGDGVGSGPVWNWQPYSGPPVGTRVLILSDLGMAGRARSDPADWARLARVLSSRGCGAVALVPFGESRWPPPNDRPLQMVTWDRASMVSTLAMRLS
jgi:hypothetical protein